MRKRRVKQNCRLFFPCSEAGRTVVAECVCARPLNSNGISLRVRRTRGVPLLSRLLNRGNPRRAARIWCAVANIAANLRALHTGPSAREFTGRKSPVLLSQIIESIGNSGAKKLRENLHCGRRQSRTLRSRMRCSVLETSSAGTAVKSVRRARGFALRARFPRRESMEKNRQITGGYQVPVPSCYARAEAADFLGFGADNR